MERDRTLTVRLSDSPRPLPRCPACPREVLRRENPHRPFCSITCRLIDLGVWLDEGYRIPGAEEPPSEEASAES